jgi:hypothetical protein
MLAVLGGIIALLGFALRGSDREKAIFLGNWIPRYSNLLRFFQYGVLILILTIFGFFLCSTLANRYHYWEQGKIVALANSVAGERLEQSAPRVRYEVEEPFVYYDRVDGKLVKIEEKRKESRYLALTSSDVRVKIDSAQNKQDNRYNYLTDFVAVYEVINSLPQRQELFFEVAPPTGYYLLQNFQVEQNDVTLQPKNPGNYSFSTILRSGQSSKFRLTYQAQGASRWVYNAQNDLLSKFRLAVNTTFPNADFASGIVPTEMKSEGTGTLFTWVFDNNVSVLNPFGVFTSTGKVTSTGTISRLLLLGPAIFLWWLLLLYLSIPVGLKNTAIAGGLFFACLLGLTYLSRAIDPTSAWAIISVIFLLLVWGLGKNWRSSLASLLCGISGAILPIFALLIPYSGITLSFAGLLSLMWLIAVNWYGLDLRNSFT